MEVNWLTWPGRIITVIAVGGVAGIAIPSNQVAIGGSSAVVASFSGGAAALPQPSGVQPWDFSMTGVSPYTYIGGDTVFPPNLFYKEKYLLSRQCKENNNTILLTMA